MYDSSNITAWKKIKHFKRKFNFKGQEKNPKSLY